MKNLINEKLRTLGIHATLAGFRFAVAAVELALEDDDRLRNVMRDIYAPVARQFEVRSDTVERNLRTIVIRAWTNNPQALMDLAGCQLTTWPTVSEFIDIIANAVRTAAVK